MIEEHEKVRGGKGTECKLPQPSEKQAESGNRAGKLILE